MTDLAPQKTAYITTTALGINLLVLHWLLTPGDDITGFFLGLFLICMALLRWRVPKAGFTAVLDVALFTLLSPLFMGLALFSAMYYGMYFAMLAAVYVLFMVDIQLGVIALLCGACGLLLRLWEKEQTRRLKTRDAEAGRYYELEALQSDLMAATAQIERMTAVTERARISREIHDNAGHELVAAYISLQTVRELLDDTDPQALALYDTALQHLDIGVNKVREAVHNLSPVTALGVEALQEICEKFPKPVAFKVYGDTRRVPVHVWHVLESCLNEGLTNIGKHALPSRIAVTVDATAYIVRLSIENDGVPAAGKKQGMGTGLRNLRHRLVAIGGSLAVAQDKANVYHLVCVVSLKDDANADNYSVRN